MKILNRKDIPGFEGVYEVDTYGIIFSKARKRRGRFGNAEIRMKYQVTKDGYFRAHLTQNGKSKLFSVHRLTALTFLKNTNSKPEINHKDGNKQNNNINNLEWVTRLENIRHSHENGLRSKKNMGKNKGRCFVVEKDILESCFEMIRNGETVTKTAKIFNINRITLLEQCQRNMKDYKTREELGVPKDVMNACFEMVRNGANIVETAKHFDVKVATLQYHCTHNMPGYIGTPRVPKETYKKCFDMIRKGSSIIGAARYFGIKPKTLYKMYNKK